MRTIRPGIMDFEPYSPGLSIDEIRAKYSLQRVIKLASNENPLGASPSVQQTLIRHVGDVFRYPRSGSPALRSALAAHLGMSEASLVIGNGSDEIIDLLIRVVVRPGEDNILIFDPSFSMYRLLAKLSGVEVRSVALAEDFQFPWDRMLDAVTKQTALVFVTTPDNPTGYAPPVQELEYAARQLPLRTLLVVDEAYMDFASPVDTYSLLSRLRDFPNVIVLRTFSKLYGLAGLRLGYGIMAPWLADALIRVKPPFSVNILAEIAGLAALRDTHFVKASLDCVQAGRIWLTMELERLGCRVFPSQANFLLFKTAHPVLSALNIFQKLLEQGVIIRPLKSYGLEEYLRVTIGTEEENRIFIREMEAVLHG